jgi:hypothetical protein
MIYGSKDRFAVQWELHDDRPTYLLPGKICFWIGGEMVGDYGLGTWLSDVVFCLRYPTGDCGNRNGSRFCALSSEAAFALIQTALVDGNSRCQIAEEEMWARFNVSVGVDVFDAYRMYLFDCENCSRLLVGHYSKSANRYVVREQRLDVGEYDAVIRQLQDELIRALDEVPPR